MIRVKINGRPHELEGPTSLPALVAEYTGSIERDGLAVGINQVVVRREEWDATEINDGDEIEIIAPFAGG